MTIIPLGRQFVKAHYGAFRLLTMIDEYSRECLDIKVARRFTSEDVLDQLTQLFIQRRLPDYIRSDNGSELTAETVRKWLDDLGGKDTIHRAGQSLEELMSGVVQRQAAGRVFEYGDS